MSEMAIETEGEDETFTLEPEQIDQETDEQETGEIQETDQDTDEPEQEDDEVEIIAEGEEQPASKKSTPVGIIKRINKLNGKIDDANSQAEKERLRAEMLEEENKLLRMQYQQSNAPKPAERPDPDDFDDHKSYLQADQKWIDDRINEAAKKQAAEILKDRQSQAATVNQNEELNSRITQHYSRVETLRIPQYEDLEDKAIDTLGNDFAKQIMANSSKSHLILAHLGANTAKAQELGLLVKNDPLRAYTEAIELGAKLSTRSKSKPAPDPETVVSGGKTGTFDQGPPGAKFE